MEPTDHWTGMFKVKTLEKYEVVEVDSIERGVHLIPCFVGHETEMASANTVSALDNYDEFWINNYSDSHTCTTRFMHSHIVVTKECKHNEHPSDIEHFLCSLRFFCAH